MKGLKYMFVALATCAVVPVHAIKPGDGVKAAGIIATVVVTAGIIACSSKNVADLHKAGKPTKHYPRG